MKKIIATIILASLSLSSYGDYFDIDEIVFSQQIMPYVLKYGREKKRAANIRLLKAYLEKYKPGTQAKLFLISDYMRAGKLKEAGALGDEAIEELAKVGKGNMMNILGSNMAFGGIRDAVRSYRMAGEKEKADKLQKRLKEIAINSGWDESEAVLKKISKNASFGFGTENSGTIPPIKIEKIDDSELKITQKEIDILNSKFKIDDTCLIFASQYGKKDSVAFLINHGVNVNAKLEDSDTTALHYATANGYLDIVKLLIKNKADINIEDKKVSPLNLAIMQGHTKIAKLLIEKGAKLNSQDMGGNTPLHNAILKNNSSLVTLLIKHNASKKIKNKKGKTPLNLLENKIKKEKISNKENAG